MLQERLAGEGRAGPGWKGSSLLSLHQPSAEAVIQLLFLSGFTHRMT